jgi:hypothetical protein
MGKGRKRDNIFIAVLFTLSACLIVLMGALMVMQPIETQSLHVEYAIEQGVIGINADKGALHYGKIPPGGNAIREVTFYNPYSKPVLISTRAPEHIGKVISGNDTFVVPPNEIVNISYVLRVPLNVSEGVYNGTIQFEIRECNSVGLWLLGETCTPDSD